MAGGEQLFLSGLFIGFLIATAIWIPTMMFLINIRTQKRLLKIRQKKLESSTDKVPIVK